MVSVDCLLLLRLLMHPGMHLVLLGTTTCKAGELGETSLSGTVGYHHLVQGFHVVQKCILVNQSITCIGRPLTKVLRRTGTSLLSRGVGGEPANLDSRKIA